MSNPDAQPGISSVSFAKYVRCLVDINCPAHKLEGGLEVGRHHSVLHGTSDFLLTAYSKQTASTTSMASSHSHHLPLTDRGSHVDTMLKKNEALGFIIWGFLFVCFPIFGQLSLWPDQFPDLYRHADP